MSSLIIKVHEISDIIPHPNTDKLEIASVGNWKTVIGKGQFKIGDKCVYFPPNSVMSKEVADKFGITKYLAPVRGETDKFRVYAARLRDEPSFGTAQPCEQDWEIGTDLVEFYGITKWDPPISIQSGDEAESVPEFHNYTDIENWGDFPGVFQDDEEIIITEKIHGSNCRLGKILVNDVWEYMAGSHSLNRKEFCQNGSKSEYWMPFENKKIKDILDWLCNDSNNVIIFGELIGTQDMKYGLKNGKRAFRAFDISINGKYLSHHPMKTILEEFKIDMVPLLYKGSYNASTIESYTNGFTSLCNIDDIKEKFKGREGIVFRPIVETFSSVLNGRKILKSISSDYHARKNKNATEGH